MYISTIILDVVTVCMQSLITHESIKTGIAIALTGFMLITGHLDDSYRTFDDIELP